LGTSVSPCTFDRAIAARGKRGNTMTADCVEDDVLNLNIQLLAPGGVWLARRGGHQPGVLRVVQPREVLADF
jgi:hypothetical protein